MSPTNGRTPDPARASSETTPSIREDSLNSNERLWVCHPDNAEAHITEYSETVGGCQVHQVAGGCTVPMRDFNRIITKEVEKQVIAEWKRAKPHLTDDDVAYSITTRLEDGRGSVVWCENLEDYIDDRIEALKGDS